MQLTVVGSGDAFGSGGRLNTCFQIEFGHSAWLLDCGASSLIGLKRLGIDRNRIDMIVVTHFHGDHFGGIPYFVLDAQFFSKRTEQLTIIGPPGLDEWFARVMETTFAGSSTAKRAFEVELVTIEPSTDLVRDGVRLRAAQVRHGAPDGPFLGYRIESLGRVLAYTGDTEWTDALIDLCRDSDLMIAEAYVFDRRVPFHLDLRTLEEKLPLLQPKRLLLTHMSDDMLERLPDLVHETAADGMIIQI